MARKIVLVGGGSFNWTPTLACDLFLREGLAGSRLVLVDINSEAAALLKVYCTKLATHAGTGWSVEVSELDAALDGAFSVTVSISTGDLEAMVVDYHVPETFGIYHTVSDTVGPGGISRTLRNVPVFTDLAQRMEKYCPDAWMVHVTNPLTQITRAVCKTSTIRCAGLCHNYAGTIAFLADFLGATPEEVAAVSVGVNHGTWLKDIRCKGKPVGPDRLTMAHYLEYAARKGGPVKTGTLDDAIEAMLRQSDHLPYYINFELYELFGVFPVGSCPHVAENWPFYLNNPETIRRHRIRRKGVLPGRREGKLRNRRKILDVVEGRTELGPLRASREGLSTILESLQTGGPSRAIVAMPNTGQVSNLPADVVVETWAGIDAQGIHPDDSGPIPNPLLGYMQLIVDEQEMAVEAALTGDRRLLHQALHLSPMVQNKDCIAELGEKLLEGNRRWLGQFFGGHAG
jgi:alpha-galactosidase